MKIHLLMFFFVSFNLIAQEGEAQTGNVLIVSGNITDRNGFPLIGANVMVNGTTINTTTDFDGKFSLEIESGKMLSISYIGFETTEILIEPDAKINFVLKEKHNQLDLNSNQISTSLTRSEMRRIRRINKKQTLGAPAPQDVEFLFGILRAITKN